MGYCPDWYYLITAARYLKVPAWELQRQPIIWQTWAHAAMTAEDKAQSQKEQAEVRKAKMKK